MGMDLAKNRAPRTMETMTSTRSAHINPAKMTDTASIGCPQFNEAADQETRQGLSRNILFYHGDKSEPTDYSTMNQLSFGEKAKTDKMLQVKKITASDPAITARPSSNLARAKANALAKESRQSTFTSTQQRTLASGRARKQAANGSATPYNAS